MDITKEKSLFEEALADFVSGLQTKLDKEYQGVCNLGIPQITTHFGRRYVKIVRTDPGSTGRSVHCFIDRKNGDVLKAASWKAPAKHARGNIYSKDSGLDGVTIYGAKYLR